MYMVSDSFVRLGRLDTEQIRWMGIQQGNIGPDGLLYSRKGGGTSLIALPLAWLGLHLPSIGPVHTTLLLTPLIHALTALYLYYTLRRVFDSIGREGALGITFLWAFASMALAYVKTFFSEPAIALALMGAFYHLARFRDEGRRLDAAAMGCWLALSLITRLANVIVFPLFGLALLAYMELYQAALESKKKRKRRRKKKRKKQAQPFWHKWLHNEWMRARLIAFMVPILLSGLFYLWYNWFRFGSAFSSGYIAGEDFSGAWLAGIAGLLISPGRGLLWYTPWLPLAWIGGRRLWELKREPILLRVAGGAILFYILLYGKWYLWSGGFSWGARFLVPILPLLAFLTAPLLFARRKRGAPLLGGWQNLLWLTGLLGFLINLIGVLWDFDLHQQSLPTDVDPFASQFFWLPRYAQITGLLRLGLQTTGSLDLAWMIEGTIEWQLLILMAGIAFAGVGAGSWGWRKQDGLSILGVGGLLSAVGLWLLLGQMRAYQAHSLQEALKQIPDTLAPQSQLWYDDPPVGEVLMNQLKRSISVTGFFVDGPEIEEQQRLRAQVLAEEASGPIYLITDGPERLQNGLDRMLLEHTFWIGELTSPAYRVARYWQGELGEPIPYNLRLSFPDGATIQLKEAQVMPQTSPGEPLTFLLRWRAETQLPESYHIFVHLYDEAGTIVLQQDGLPAQTLRPTNSWQPGELITDRHAFLLPSTLPPGLYTLHIGIYRLSDLGRAATPEGQNEANDARTDEVLIEVQVR